MVDVTFEDAFERTFLKFRHAGFKERVKGQIEKIILNPTVGKPMRNQRKGTREVHIGPYRLSYVWISEENRIIFLDLYHKDEQ